MKQELQTPEEYQETAEQTLTQINKNDARTIMQLHSLKTKKPKFLKKSIKQKEWFTGDELSECLIGG